MPRPGKPAGLITRAETKADKQARRDKESAVKPARALPASPPSQLDGYSTAQSVWRYVMRRYSETEAEIVSGFDLYLLINFCMSFEELARLRKMYDVAYAAWLEISQAHEEAVKADQFEIAVSLAIKTVGAFEALNKLDTRIDRKKDLIHKFSQSLYLTPRARAGVVPPGKPEEPPVDDMEALLDDVTDYVNGAP